MIDLYVVESPLQALSAAEAKAVNGNEVGSVIFVKPGPSSRKTHYSHLEKAVSFGKWKEVIWMSFSKYSGLKYHLSLIFSLLRIKKKYRGKVRRLYLGEFRSDWMLYLRCTVDPIETYLLDDGAATLAVQNDFLSKSIFWPRDNSSLGLRKLIKKVLYAPVYDRNAAQKMINLFTSFDLVPVPGQALKRHSFEFARKNIKASKISNEVYYFGAKYSEAGIMTLCDEMDFLEKIFEYYKVRNIGVVYVPHRDDSCAKLKVIEERFEVPIRRLGCAAELYFSLSDYKPSRIAAAYSSVLNSLRHFWGSEACDSFVIPESMLSDKSKVIVSEVYSYYQSVGINLIKIESSKD